MDNFKTQVLLNPPNASLIGVGDVDGPASSTDNAIVRFDGATGKLIQNSTVIMTDNGDVSMPSTATLGLQLYNTADQVTNYERFALKFGSNIAQIGTDTGTSASARPVHIYSQTANNGATFSRIDVQNGAFPLFRQGLFTTATGTTAASFATAGFTFVSLLNGTSQATSGTNIGLSLTPTYNQASGTAANTDLLINRTETAVGSGAQYLIQAQSGGTDRFLVGSTGNTSVNFLTTGSASPQANARILVQGGFSRSSWTVNGVVIRADAATYTDTSTAGSGTAATAVFTSFAQPTLAATNTNVTTTDSATVYIANAPANGTNNTSTRPHALWIDAGSFRLDGTDGAGAGAGTLANAPSAGDPDKWIPINSDGVQYWMPVWAA